MPSPFPGMNPYFEQPGVWHGFHTRFLVFFQSALAQQLGGNYFAEIEESLYLEYDDPPRPFAVADVGVSGGPERAKVRGPGAAAPAVGVVPMTIERPWRSLTIRRKAGGKIVTIIELLSPSNKAAGDEAGYGLRLYRT